MKNLTEYLQKWQFNCHLQYCDYRRLRYPNLQIFIACRSVREPPGPKTCSRREIVKLINYGLYRTCQQGVFIATIEGETGPQLTGFSNSVHLYCAWQSLGILYKTENIQRRPYKNRSEYIFLM